MISNQSIAEAVRDFLEKGSVAYSGAVIAKDPERSWRVLVLSYTESPEGTLPTEAEARSNIERSRKILDQLCTSLEFAHALQGKTIVYEFCRDYGTGAYLIASQEGINFRWAQR